MITTLVIAFIRAISALGGTVTDVTLFNTITIGTHYLRVKAAASLVVVEREALEAASIVSFIRLI